MKLEETLNDIVLQNIEEQIKLAEEILKSPPKTLEELKTIADKQYILNQQSLQIVSIASITNN